MKTKIFSSLLMAVLLFFMVNTAQAEFLSLSVGMPVQHTFDSAENSNGDKLESDGVSGLMVHASIPLFPGLGYESYETGIKDDDDAKLVTEMYDIFYLFPIPVINFTVGLGYGKAKLDCDSCADYFESDLGNATQYYLQLGVPIIPLFDIHLSYHAVTTKIKGKNSGTDDIDFSGNLMALGVQLTF